MLAETHQQVSPGRPAASAQRLSPPHRGQVPSHCSSVFIRRPYYMVKPAAIIADASRGVSMAGDEDKGFSDEMADVVPLRRAPRVPMRTGANAQRGSSQELRRQAST